MAAVRISCPFKGRDSCNSGGGKGLIRKYFIDHLGAHHFSSDESKVYLKDNIAGDSNLFSSLDAALKKVGIWLCGVCLCTQSLSKNCTHSNGRVILSPTSVNVSSEAYEAPPLGSSAGCSCSGFDVELLGRVLLKPLRTVKSIPPKLHLGVLRFSFRPWMPFLHVLATFQLGYNYLSCLIVFWAPFCLRIEVNGGQA